MTLHGYFACGEYLRTLRLVSELPDLRVANANPATTSQGEIPRTSHQKEKEKAGRMSCRYGNLLCGEKVALNVPRILSRSASRRTTQDALAGRAYANPATASPGEIPRTGHQKEKEKAGRMSCFPFW